MPSGALSLLVWQSFLLQTAGVQHLDPGRWSLLVSHQSRCVPLRGGSSRPALFVYASPSRWRTLPRLLETPGLPRSVPVVLCPLPDRVSLTFSALSLAFLQRGLDLRAFRQMTEGAARRLWRQARTKPTLPERGLFSNLLSKAVGSRRLIAQLADNAWEALQLGIDPWSGEIGLRRGSQVAVISTTLPQIQRPISSMLHRAGEGTSWPGPGQRALERMARWPRDHRFLAEVLLGRPGLSRYHPPPGAILLQRGQPDAIRVHYLLASLPLAPWLLRPLEDLPLPMRPQVTISASFIRPYDPKARSAMLHWVNWALARPAPPGPRALAQRPPLGSPVGPRARRLLAAQWHWADRHISSRRPVVLVDGIPVPNPMANLPLYLLLRFREHRGLLTRFLAPRPGE